MKKSLLVSVFAALAMMVSVNSFAQEKATKEDYKEIAKQEKVLNKDLQKKAIKEARKEAKKLTKEGFKLRSVSYLWTSRLKTHGRSRRR